MRKTKFHTDDEENMIWNHIKNQKHQVNCKCIHLIKTSKSNDILNEILHDNFTGT